MHSLSIFLIIASLTSISVSKPTYNGNVQDDMYSGSGGNPYMPSGNDYGDNYGNDNYVDYNYSNNYGYDNEDYNGDSYGADTYGDDTYGDDYGYGAPKKPCKCDCSKTPVYEMDAACRKKCIKPTATKPCTTPTPMPTKPCTTSVEYKATPTGTSPVKEGTSPVNEQRPVCSPITVTKTVDQIKTDYKTLTATQTVHHTSVITSVKVVPTTVVQHKTVEKTVTCTKTSTVHDVQYKTVSVTKTVTVGAKPTEETKKPCHSCEAEEKSDYGESKPYAGADANHAQKPTPDTAYPTIVPTGYAGNKENAY